MNNAPIFCASGTIPRPTTDNKIFCARPQTVVGALTRHLLYNFKGEPPQTFSESLAHQVRLEVARREAEGR